MSYVLAMHASLLGVTSNTYCTCTLVQGSAACQAKLVTDLSVAGAAYSVTMPFHVHVVR